jgi:catechol 2,3-dioxygenase-like lactoylglutathione lyase family enzyme
VAASNPLAKAVQASESQIKFARNPAPKARFPANPVTARTPLPDSKSTAWEFFTDDYGERADAAHPDRVYIAIYSGPKPHETTSRHWCFKAKSRSEVDAFWRAGIAAGGTDDGPPGLRHYHAAYYGAFLRDPDGNKVEAVCHRAV